MMRLSPLILILAAGGVTLGIGQALLPTAHAQAVPSAAAPASYRVSVKGLHAAHTKSGVAITGKITNAGQETLTYTSVVVVFSSADGAEVARTNAYLTTGPVGPGQSAEFRAVPADLPAFTTISLRLREAGHPVTVEAQAPERH